MEKQIIPYFVGSVTLQTAYFRFPISLNEDSRLKNLSWLAKMTYVILLDKAQLAYRMGKLDEYGRPMIDNFTRKDIMAISGCSERTAKRVLSSLYPETGVGLISYVSRPGHGNIYYVHDIQTLPTESNSYDFITGETINTFRYWMLPQAFFTEEEYRPLSFEAKLIYAALLARTALSNKNHMTDELGRIYIYYTIRELKAEFNFGTTTIIDSMKELSDSELIETKKSESHRSTRIYVRNFTSVVAQKRQEELNRLLEEENQKKEQEGPPQEQGGATTGTLNEVNEKRGAISGTLNDVNNPEGGHFRNTTPEGGPSQEQRGAISGTPLSNYTDLDNTSLSYTNTDIYNSISPSISQETKTLREREGQKQSCAPDQIIRIRKALEYEKLLSSYPEAREVVDTLIDIFSSVMTTERTYGTGVPSAELRRQYMAVDSGCLEYTVTKILAVKKDIKNPIKYYASALYNNAMTFKAERRRKQENKENQESTSAPTLTSWLNERAETPSAGSGYGGGEGMRERYLRCQNEIIQIKAELKNPYLSEANRRELTERLGVKESMTKALKVKLKV